jgi:thioredoxin 2
MTLVPCTRCEKINRVSMSRAEAEAPICGACKTALALDHGVVALDGNSLIHLVARSPLPIIVDFWAPGCLPCKVFEPIFQRSARAYEGRLVFASVNSAQCSLIAEHFKIRGVPSLIFFSNGDETARRSGALSSDQLSAWLESLSGALSENFHHAA